MISSIQRWHLNGETSFSFSTMSSDSEDPTLHAERHMVIVLSRVVTRDRCSGGKARLLFVSDNGSGWYRTFACTYQYHYSLQLLYRGYNSWFLVKCSKNAVKRRQAQPKAVESQSRAVMPVLGNTNMCSSTFSHWLKNTRLLANQHMWFGLTTFDWRTWLCFNFVSLLAPFVLVFANI